MKIPGLNLLTGWKGWLAIALVSASLSAGATFRLVNNHWEARQLRVVIAHAEQRDQRIQALLANQGRLNDRNIELEQWQARQRARDQSLFDRLREERENDESPVLDMPLPDSSPDRVRCAWRPSDPACPE